MSAAPEIEAALAGSELVAGARASLDQSGAEVWIVGGALRDVLLGGPIGDLDLAVAGEPEPAARMLGRRLNGTAFELSDQFRTWRVQVPGKAWTIDLTALRGPTIEADLRLRDFTVNAVAAPLGGGEPIDPTGGIADLRAGTLRMASASAFRDDPLRLMRAARLGARFELEPDPETLALARRDAARASEPAGERRFAELRGMIAGPRPLLALELLDQLQLTAVVLPQLEAMRGVGQSANHHLDAHDHTIEVLRRWLEIERDLPTYAGEVSEQVAAALAAPLADELTRGEGIRFAAILHDIGKPATRTEQAGFVGFRGHDTVGAEMVVELCRDLRTSRRFSSYQAALTRHHLVLGFMTHERPLSRRRVWGYLALTGAEAIDVTMLTLADRLSAKGSRVADEAIEAHLELGREMLAEIVAVEAAGRPEPLLDGSEIGALLGLRGEDVGRAVRELAAAQFAGEVADRAGAEAHLREFWESRDP